MPELFNRRRHSSSQKDDDWSGRSRSRSPYSRPVRPHTPLMPHPDLASSSDGFPVFPKGNLVVGSTILRLQKVPNTPTLLSTNYPVFSLDSQDKVEKLLNCASANAGQWIEKITMFPLFNCAEIYLKRRVQAFKLYKELCTIGKCVSNEVQCRWVMPHFSNHRRNSQLQKRWDNVFGTFFFKYNQDLNDPIQLEEFEKEMHLLSNTLLVVKGVELYDKSVIDLQSYSDTVKINFKKLLEDKGLVNLASVLFPSVSSESEITTSPSSIYSDDLHSLSLVPNSHQSITDQTSSTTTVSLPLVPTEFHFSPSSSNKFAHSTSLTSNSNPSNTTNSQIISSYGSASMSVNNISSDFSSISDLDCTHKFSTNPGNEATPIDHFKSPRISFTSWTESHLSSSSNPGNSSMFNHLNQSYSYIEHSLYRSNSEDYPSIYDISRYLQPCTSHPYCQQ